MQKPPFAAHTPNDDGRWQPLECHLLGVAQKAQKRAMRFDAGAMGYMAGLMHDVGKFRQEFQGYLLRCHESPESARRGEVAHSPSGCFFCEDASEVLWPIIAGHHSGIYQLDDNRKADYLAKHRADQDEMPEAAREFLRQFGHTPELAARFQNNASLLEPLLRMLFSCLVDADSEDTAVHTGEHINLSYPSLADCRTCFGRTYLSKYRRALTDLDRIRRSVYVRALRVSHDESGFFSLTAPTGSGKTLAALAFALKHARANQRIERIIYAAPYTSIIDQTAKEYRKYLPPGAVLEHHSAIEPKETELQTPMADRIRQETERWAAPVIVTTTVQLFESLFANRRSKCRKLHNVANSVIILDEAQCLPPKLLDPTLDMLRALVDGFGCSVLLCTATQPALSGNTPLTKKLPAPTEIVRDVPALFRGLKRVVYDFGLSDGTLTVGDLAQEVINHETVLVIANTKRLAIDLYKALGDKQAFHLSTLLHPAHRLEVLKQIGQCLPAPCRVISTQVVEAGVDLDFPIVFREFGPLDRMVQAAGRCNRNGIPGQAPFGRTCIFRIAGATAPPGEYSLAIQAAQTKIAEGRDLQDPETYESFFRLFYRDLADTGQCIQKRRLCFDYPEVASLYRMIDDDTVPLLIESEVLRHKKAADVFRSVNVKGFATRADWRALQQFAVSVRAKEVGRRFPETDIQREWIPGLHLWKGYYHPRLGLGETIEMAIEDLITGG